MTKDGDRTVLRRLLGDVTALLGDRNTHETLTETFAVLGMPPVDEGSKRERVKLSFALVPDSDLLRLAGRFLQMQSVDASTRNQLQDALWAEASPPEIPMRTRREMARAIDPTALVRHAARFIAVLDRFWVLDDDPLAAWSFSPSTRSLRARIERHVILNSDWSGEDLFEALGAFEAGDARFARFVEAAVAADVLLDETAQRHLAGTMNKHLRAATIELRETGSDGGYPRFTLVPTQLAHTRRPKNVIFASPTKPDIRFRSAVDNDIELVSGDALVYDRTVTDDGICWRDLQSWWQETQQITDDTEAKNTLYARLRSSLPNNSPGQRGTSSTATTGSSKPRCTTCPRSCPRYGCTGTRRRSRNEALRPSCASAWTSCSCCPTDNGSS